MLPCTPPPPPSDCCARQCQHSLLGGTRKSPFGDWQEQLATAWLFLSYTQEATCKDLKWDFLAGGGKGCRCTSAPRVGHWSPERNVQTAPRGSADLHVYRNHFSILSVHIFTKLCKFIENSLEVYRPNTWQRFLWEGERRKGELSLLFLILLPRLHYFSQARA